MPGLTVPDSRSSREQTSEYVIPLKITRGFSVWGRFQIVWWPGVLVESQLSKKGSFGPTLTALTRDLNFIKTPLQGNIEVLFFIKTKGPETKVIHVSYKH